MNMKMWSLVSKLDLKAILASELMAMFFISKESRLAAFWRRSRMDFRKGFLRLMKKVSFLEEFPKENKWALLPKKEKMFFLM